MTGAEFRALRVHLNYTQAEFSELFNVARTTICKWEQEGFPQERGDLQRAYIEHVISRLRWNAPKARKRKLPGPRKEKGGG